jgi:hypothetical protein
VALDGEWENPTSLADISSDTFPSGNGTAGGTFEFRFNALSSDANRDLAVDAADYAIWRANYATAADATFADGDSSGDGAVDGADYTLWADQFGEDFRLLPAPIAAGTSTPASTAADDASLVAERAIASNVEGAAAPAWQAWQRAVDALLADEDQELE